MYCSRLCLTLLTVRHHLLSNTRIMQLLMPPASCALGCAARLAVPNLNACPSCLFRLFFAPLSSIPRVLAMSGASLDCAHLGATPSSNNSLNVLSFHSLLNVQRSRYPCIYDAQPWLLGPYWCSIPCHCSCKIV